MEANEQFHQSSRLSPEQLRPLFLKNDHPALFRFILLYSFFIIACFAVVYTWNQSAWWWAISLFWFGLVGCSCFAAEHETVHLTAFRSRRLNQVAARLLGVAHLYPSIAFRELHYMHHRYTHVPGKDPEISLGDKPGPAVIRPLPMYLSWISGLPLLLFKIMMTLMGALGMPEPVRRRLFPFIHPEVRLALAMESIYILLIYSGFVYLALNGYPGFWGILIGQVVAHALLAMYVAPEHNGLPHEGDVLDRTRSMRTSKLVTFWMWNMPYHAEHHAYPGVPFHALPQLHALMEADLKHRAGYGEFHWDVWRGKVEGS